MEEENLKINEKKEKKSFKLTTLIIVAIACLLIGIIIMYTLNATGILKVEKKIAKVNGEAYSMDDVDKLIAAYMGENASISFLLEAVDANILKNLYQIDESLQAEIDDSALYYTYYYGLSEEYAKTYATTAKLRDLYYLDYISNNYISEDEVKDYYDNDVIGNVECEHILISPDTEKFTDEQALALANEIINKLNTGASFSDIVNEYTSSETYSKYVTNEAFTCQTLTSPTNSSETEYTLFSSLETTFVDALLALKDNTYSVTPIKTSYGYHIIYRKNQAEKENFETLKKTISEILAKKYDEEVIQTEDPGLFFNLLKSLREENGFKIYDKDLQTQYKEYCDSYNAELTADSDDDIESEGMEISEEAENNTTSVEATE